MDDAGTGSPHRTPIHPVRIAVGVLALLGALPFFWATTFTGDDHLFLAFARNVRNPLVAFTTDMHGGEFYRPLPMLLWWLLGRGGGLATWPFALVAYLLHLAVSVETGILVARASNDRRTAALAGIFFFVAPFTREGAYWFSASTDLLAAAFGLGTVVATGGARLLWANVLLLGACLSKESAAVVPALSVLMVRAQHPEVGWKPAVIRGASLLPVVVLVFACRTLVLGGFGNSGDVAATAAAKLAQLVFGLVHALPGEEVFSSGPVTIVGLAAWVALAIAATRARKLGRAAAYGPPLVWMVLAVLPLLAARWVVGARYFYLPMVGVAWLAAQVLRQAPPLVAVVALAGLGGLSFAQAASRHADIRSYEERVTTARRAVVAGVAAGHRTFHVTGGIKDIDLAVKEDPRLAGSGHEDLVVLGDVPASFVSLPAGAPSRIDFLLARPPLPPSGAYVFGARRIAGLARRGDDPTLDEVLARLPDLRFIRLRLGPGGRVIYRDVTDTMNLPNDEPE